MSINRRQFFNITAFSLLATQALSKAENTSRNAIACQEYPWMTFARRDDAGYETGSDEHIGDVVAAGFQSYEPLFESREEVRQLAPILARHKVGIHSFYVNSILHDPERAEQNVETVLQISHAAKVLGAKIVVTNPSPIQWGSGKDKSDEQLRFQAKMLNQLGAALADDGLVLAYHNHDAEMRQSAREFHHMMVGTDPQNVSLCLDAHWIYRGAGNSPVALFDIVTLYLNRIAELHLRQSKDGVWTEAFSEGDIDYPRLVEVLVKNSIKPHIVLEQAIEKGSPHNLDAVEAHRRSLEYAERIFGRILG